MNKKQIIGSILGGLFATSVAYFHFAYALRSRFAIDPALGFSELGNVTDSLTTILVLFISVLLGTLVACIMAKERYSLISILTSISYLVMTLITLTGLSALLLLVKVGEIKVSLPILQSELMVKFYIMLGLSIFTIIATGLLGAFLI